MLIANPIYDIMFKRLMEDMPIARFFIETLIGETLEDLNVRPQEYRYRNPSPQPGHEFDEAYRLLLVYKLDYIATIKTSDGEYKKVLIEIQKARNTVDVMRFRNYLAEQYKLEDEIQTPAGSQIKPLPIITIYLLGFKLANLESPAIKVERKYIDLIFGKWFDLKSEFIELLTHNSYIVQIPRIQPKLQSRLDALLSVFEQTNFLDVHGTIKEYTYDIQYPEVKRIVDVLNHEGVDLVKRKEIDDEIEAWRIIEGGNRQEYARMRRELEKQEKELEEATFKPIINTRSKQLVRDLEKIENRVKVLNEGRDKKIKDMQEAAKT